MMIYYVLTRKRIVTAFESITTENESQKQLRILWLAWHGTGFFIPLDVETVPKKMRLANKDVNSKKSTILIQIA